MQLEIVPIRAFADNYLWLFRPLNSLEACVVDPGDPAPVQRYLEEQGLRLSAILVTHHHRDHTGGVAELAQQYSAPVYGPYSERIPSISHPLKDGDSIQVLGARFQVMAVPGHTLDHIAYYCPDPLYQDKPVLFCGDTLFAGGCGRVFEGTLPMMHASLSRLAALPPETQVFCAHEYTLANLRFAQAVTPDSAALAARISLEQQRRAQDVPTVPTSIGMELATNPFLRCGEAELVSAAQERASQPLGDPAAVFGVIRAWKDGF